MRGSKPDPVNVGAHRKLVKHAERRVVLVDAVRQVRRHRLPLYLHEADLPASRHRAEHVSQHGHQHGLAVRKHVPQPVLLRLLPVHAAVPHYARAVICHHRPDLISHQPGTEYFLSVGVWVNQPVVRQQIRSHVVRQRLNGIAFRHVRLHVLCNLDIVEQHLVCFVNEPLFLVPLFHVGLAVERDVARAGLL